jgi:hypothetical protein
VYEQLMNASLRVETIVYLKVEGDLERYGDPGVIGEFHCAGRRMALSLADLQKIGYPRVLKRV